MILHHKRGAHRMFRVPFHWYRVIDQNDHGVAGESLQCSALRQHNPTDGGVKCAQHRHHFFRLGPIGERRETTQVDEQHAGRRSGTLPVARIAARSQNTDAPNRDVAS